MLVVANTPRPVSYRVFGLVQMGRFPEYVHGLELDTNAKCTPVIGSRPGRCRVSLGSRRAVRIISGPAVRMYRDAVPLRPLSGWASTAATTTPSTPTPAVNPPH